MSKGQKQWRVIHLVTGNRFGGVESMLLSLARAEAEGVNGRLTSEFWVFREGRLSKTLQEVGAVARCAGEVRLSRPWTLGPAHIAPPRPATR